MTEPCDVIIVGAGMVGATLALALGEGGMRVAVLDARTLDAAADASLIPLRVSAINEASRILLQRLGVWARLPEERIGAFQAMHVWDAETKGEIRFDSAEVGEPALGYIVENPLLEHALWGQLHQHPKVSPRFGIELQGLKVNDTGAVLTLSGDAQLAAPLVVGADGSDSLVRQLAGFSTRGHAYRQGGLVTTVRHTSNHQATARQVFLPGGPLAFLPLADGRSSIVWSIGEDRAAELLAMGEVEFLAALQQAFGMSLGELTACGPRAAFPLRAQYATSYVRDRVALVGDAAHTVHPLAGQGVNLGLMDAAALAETLLDARSQQRDHGAWMVLRRYERWRKGENQIMMTAMDGFNRLFGSTLAPVRWLRETGLHLTNAATPVKNLLARRAMGLVGDIPSLARRRPGSSK